MIVIWINIELSILRLFFIQMLFGINNHNQDNSNFIYLFTGALAKALANYKLYLYG